MHYKCGIITKEFPSDEVKDRFRLALHEAEGDKNAPEGYVCFVDFHS